MTGTPVDRYLNTIPNISKVLLINPALNSAPCLGVAVFPRMVFVSKSNYK